MGAVFIFLNAGDRITPWLITRAVTRLLLLVLAFNLFSLFTFWRGRGRLQSYELRLFADRVVQSMQGVPSITITQDEVTLITETARYGIVVNTADKKKRFVIWPSTEGYEDVKAKLSEWRPISEPEPVSVWRIPRGVISVVSFGLLLALLSGRTPVVVIPAAVGLIGLYVWTLVELPRQSKVLRSARLLMTVLVLGLIALAIFRVMVVLR